LGRVDSASRIGRTLDRRGLLTAMTKYSPEERAAILAAGRAAIADAEATLAKPRPEIAWPPVEDRVAKWKREADEQAARFARERAALIDSETSQLAHDKLAGGMITAERQFILQLLAELVAELRHEFELRRSALSWRRPWRSSHRRAAGRFRR
jgi:hypothetical protein